MNLPTCSKQLVPAPNSNQKAVALLTPQILKAMKLTVVFLTAFLLQASAGSFAQNVTIRVKDAPLSKVFREIEKQTGYGFLYTRTMLQNADRVTLDVKNEPVNNVLQMCFNNQTLDYSIQNNTIVISEKKTLPIPILQASAINITGHVTDEDGNPIMGVSVFEKGTKNGAITNSNGDYSLPNVSENGALEFTFVGYQSQQIKVRNRNIINVKLVVLVQSLDETIVIGYGTSTRRDLTGSVSSVPSDVFENPTFPDIGYAMQGQVAGMNILTGDGSPGEPVQISIRGVGSILGNTTPLFVVDGVPMPSEFNLNDLDPQSIQAIDVLKGASSAAIYGSRAASGVIIISLKKGKRSVRPTIKYTFNQGYDQFTSKIDVLTSAEFKYMLFEGAVNQAKYLGLSDLSGYIQYQPFLTPGYFKDNNTNWLNEMLQNSTTQNHNLSVSGGADNTSYLVSLGYTKDQGMMRHSGFDRYNVNLALNSKITKWLDFGLNVLGNKSIRQIATETLFGATKGRPDIRAYNDDGTVYENTYLQNGNGQRLLIESPLANLLQSSNVNKSLSTNASAFLQFNLLPGLNIKSRFNYYTYSSIGKLFYASTTSQGSGFGFIRSGRLYDSENETLQTEFENSINYDKRFGDHSISAVAATSFLAEDRKYKQLLFDDFPDDNIQNEVYQGATFQTARGYHYKGYLVSYIGRVNYKYKNKYLLTASIRSDGSSKFSKNNAYGTFPAVAAAYIISNEDFLKGVKWLDMLKLRASTGKTGMADVGYYKWRTTYESSRYLGSAAVIPENAGNENLKWESTNQTDLGLDFSLFDSRISGSIVYYTKNTDGLLYPFTMAPSTGFDDVTVNFAQIKNSGFDIDLNLGIISKKSISWNLGLNFNNNKNIVKKLDKDYITSEDGSQTYSTSIIKEGYPIGLIYGFKTQGIYHSQEEVDADKALAAASGKEYQKDMFPGEIRYKDLNGDGYVDMTTVIGNPDRAVLGHALPDFSGGFNTSFRYKNWSLIVLGSYSYGNDKVWSQELYNYGSSQVQPTNVWRVALKRWTPENPDSRYPSFRLNRTFPTSRFNDFSVYDASFLKIQRINIGYTISPEIIKKLKIVKAVNVYASVNNLYTFTKYPGPNPESYSTSNIERAGFDYSTFPQNRTYNFGINLSF